MACNPQPVSRYADNTCKDDEHGMLLRITVSDDTLDVIQIRAETPPVPKSYSPSSTYHLRQVTLWLMVPWQLLWECRDIWWLPAKCLLIITTSAILVAMIISGGLGVLFWLSGRRRFGFFSSDMQVAVQEFLESRRRSEIQI